MLSYIAMCCHITDTWLCTKHENHHDAPPINLLGMWVLILVTSMLVMNFLIESKVCTHKCTSNKILILHTPTFVQCTMHKFLSNIFSQILIGQLSEELGAGCWLVLFPVEGEGEVGTIHHSTRAVSEEGILCHRPLVPFALLSPEDTPA